MQVSNTFRERLGTRGRDFVTEEGNFGETENALGGVEQDALRLEFSEEVAEVLVVFLGRTTRQGCLDRRNRNPSL